MTDHTKETAMTPQDLRPDEESPLTPWNDRGFMDFGHGIRESSAAMWPKCWDDDDLIGTGSPDGVQLDTMRAVAVDPARHLYLRRSCALFVVFAECVANPRWLGWTQPDRSLVDFDENHTVAVHPLGYMRWQCTEGEWTQTIHIEIDG